MTDDMAVKVLAAAMRRVLVVMRWFLNRLERRQDLTEEQRRKVLECQRRTAELQREADEMDSR